MTSLLATDRILAQRAGDPTTINDRRIEPVDKDRSPSSFPTARFTEFDSVALSARPSAFRSDDRILRRELVTVFAMRLHGIDRARADASQRIDSRRDGFNMIGVDAISVPAQMIEIQSIRNGTVDAFKVDDVRLAHLPFDTDLPVSATRCQPLPRPTWSQVSAILNAKLFHRVRRLASNVSLEVPQRNALDPFFARVVLRGDSGALTASALTESVGNIWGRIGLHFWNLHHRFRSAIAGSVDALPGFSLPQLYPTSPEVSA